ncbi:hypothetical protein BJV82DRAFT_18074 [Fennellomyces sp. T-0311]|nr:hypothetical protein BJV82DRAFT_18074 [Fennellomyces sp. T-0311]
MSHVAMLLTTMTVDELKQQLLKLQDLSGAMVPSDYSTEGAPEGSISNSQSPSVISASSRSHGLSSSSSFSGPPVTSSLYRTGKSPQRLPSIGAFSATISNLGAAVLRPPVGYSAPTAEESNRSGSVSPLLDGPGTDRIVASPGGRSKATSPDEQKSFSGDYAPSRPLTTLLSLGSHSQLLNPAPDDDQDTDRATRNHVKRLRPNEL